MPFAPDVIVVGAGPVGLVAALALVRAGVRVLVLEKRAGLSAASLASTIHPPTLEILDELDVLGRVIGLGRRIGTVQYRDADGVFAEFALAGLASATPFPFRLHLEQSRITPVLIDMLDASPLARVRFGAGVLHVRQDGAGVEAVLDGETVRADWLLGADGARSAVRAAMQVGFAGEDYPDRILRVMTADDLQQVLPGLAGVSYLFNGPRSVSFLHMPECWRIILRVPGDVDASEAMDPAWIADRFAALVPGMPMPTITGVDMYGASRRVADRFRVGRVVLMGDAAHVTSTRGGMNMNCGIHDAWTVARALAAGEVEAAVAERERVAREMLIPRTDRQVTGGAAWAQSLRTTAADPAAAATYLHRAAMLDMLDRGRRDA